MTPFQQAQAVYEREPCARTFEADLYLHLAFGGTVLSTPTVFMMARPVFSHWPEDRLKDPRWAEQDGDAWYVWLLAGHGPDGWGALPPKKWLGGERFNVIRWRKYDRLSRLYRPTAPRPAA